MRHFEDSVRLADEPRIIGERLIADLDEFTHIREAAPLIGWLFSERALFLAGGQKAAIIAQPRWQGPLRTVSEFLFAQVLAPQVDWNDPEYLVVFDRPVWSALDAERRERLVFHELSHVVQSVDEFGVARRSRVTGKPLLKLGPHDVEAFHAEIVRYGPEITGIEDTCTAIAEGIRNARRRRFDDLDRSA